MSATLRTLRLERLQAANALIEIIASHGRRFFFHKPPAGASKVGLDHRNLTGVIDDVPTLGRIAKLEIDARNKVWLIDEYTQRRVNTHAKDDWEGFSHGGTLRSLVATMRDYVIDGKLLSFGTIAPLRDDGSNLWGYEPTQAIALRAAAGVLPLFATKPVPA